MSLARSAVGQKWGGQEIIVKFNCNKVNTVKSNFNADEFYNS